MFQVIETPMGSDPGLFFANLFLAHKEADWVKANVGLEQSMFEKSIIPFGLLMTCYH